MSAEEIAKKSIQVASEICVFTNKNITLEKIQADETKNKYNIITKKRLQSRKR